MTPLEAKAILTLYRPGSADADDPEFAEALQLCGRDAELKRWFDEHCALYLALRARFKQIPVAEGLKEQILAERKVHTVPLRRRPAVLAVAASIALLLGLGNYFYWRTPPEDTSFTAYRERMVGIALRDYGMDLSTNDLTQIRAYLAKNSAPADYVLPAGLQKAPTTGCAIEPWQGAKVSLICFDSGQPHPPGRSNDVWFFVIDRSSVRGGPQAIVASLAKVNLGMTASWSDDKRTYLLVVDGDEQFLRKYL